MKKLPDPSVNCVKRIPGNKVAAVYVNAKTPVEPINNEENNSMENNGIMDTIKNKITGILPPFSNDALGVFSLIDKSLSIMLDRIAEHSIKEEKPDILIEVSRENYGLFDFHKAAEIINAGELEARSVLLEQKN